MKRLHASAFVFASALVGASWSGLALAEDSQSGKSTSSDRTQSGPTAPSGAGASTNDPNVPSPGGATVSPASPTSPAAGSAGSMSTSGGTGSGSIYGTGSHGNGSYGASTQSPSGSGSTGHASSASTTTTTAAQYDTYASADRDRGELRPHRALLATGAGIFVGSYATSAVVGGMSNTDADRNLFIPLAGPWLDMADRPCGIGDCGTREDINHVMLIGSGVSQGVGVGLAIASLFIPEGRETASTSAKAKARAAAAKPEVKVLPIGVRAGGGFGAVGTF